jgi:LuxR family transcriptional regulator (chaperone HchA-associated)
VLKRDPLTDRLLTTLLAVERSKHFDDLQLRVRDFVNAMGYDRILLFSVDASLDGRIEQIYWLEGAWLPDNQPLDVSTYLRHCPATQHVLWRDEAFFWSKTYSVKGERYRIVSQPRGHGLHGIQIPVFGPAGLQGAFSFAGQKVDTNPASRLALVALANVAFFAVRRLVQPPKPANPEVFSKREAEILALTAAGWRQAAIAETLGISLRTVENHLRNVRRKTGASSTAQVISKFIR